MVKKAQNALPSASKTHGKGKLVSRRDFLKGGAAAAALVVATAAGYKGVSAQTPTPSPGASPSPVTSPSPSASPAAVTETYIFFNPMEADTVKAIFARLIPGDAQDPGAVEAGAHLYLDKALNGAYSNQQVTYQRGLASVNAYSQSKFQKDFSELAGDQQDGILTDMQNGAATGFTVPAATAFFSTLLQHVREGTFCDPVYGGNLNLAGWKMVGFPGAQFAYGETDEVIGADQANKSILTLTDLEKIPMPMTQSGF